MSENDQFAQELAKHQEDEYRRLREELENQIEAGFRMASNEEQQRQVARQNRNTQDQAAQQQEDDKNAALGKAQEYEDENLRKAREAGQEIAGNPEETGYGYAAEKPTTATATMRDYYAAQNNETEGYQGDEVSNEDATTLESADTAQTVTYDMDGNTTQTNTASFSADPISFEMNTNETNEAAPTMELATSANETVQNQQQPDYDTNDPFAAWRAENQMRAATLDLNQSEQIMYNDDFSPQAQETISVGSAQPADMGLYKQDLSNDNRVLHQTIRTANTDETGPITTGPEPDTQTANTQEGTKPVNAKDADSDNRIYVDDQTFAARFDDTIFWKSDERKKAWEQFVNTFKNAKTLEDLIGDGFFAALEVGLDMINAYMDWEVAESKKLAAFIKESKKTYDAENNKAKGISPQEGYKRTHDAIHMAKDFWKTLEQQKFYGELPKNEWGGIDLDKCTSKQKAMLGDFQVKYATSSPEFKKSMENMLGREFNAEDIMLAAEGTRTTLWGYEKRPDEKTPPQAEAPDKGPEPEGPHTGPQAPTQPRGPVTPSPRPTPQGPAPQPAPTDKTPQPQTIVPPNRTLETKAPEQLVKTVQTPGVYPMDPIVQKQENVVIDGKTGDILDGIQVPDKETMRNVTPPKGPIKNARPVDFGDLPRRASDNIRDMHDISEAMRENNANARLIDLARNGGRPTPGGKGMGLALGNAFGNNMV